MSGERALGLIGQNATYSTTGPTVTLGTALSGYRTAADAVTASDLADGQRCTVLIQNADLTSRAVWAATYDNANGQFDRVSEILLVGDAFGDSEAVTVRVVDDGSPPALYTPAVTTNALALDCGGYHQSYHRVTLDAAINASGITITNAPSTGVVELTVEFRQSGGPHTVPVTAWSGISGIAFDTEWHLYSDSTPTVVTLRSTDGGTTWRARNNAPASALDLADYGSGSATENQAPLADGSGGTAWTSLGSAAFTDSTAYAAAAEGVTNGDSHDHSGGDGAQIAYASLSGTPTIPSPSDATPQAPGTAAAGTSADYSRADHVHALPPDSGGGGTGEIEVLAPALASDGLTAASLDISGFAFTASTLS